MSETTSKPLLVAIPAEIGVQIELLAKQQHRSSEDIVCDACRQHLAALDDAQLDEQYARGYEELAEDVTELEALLPHLPIPQEEIAIRFALDMK